jgi:hypothetical protein
MKIAKRDIAIIMVVIGVLFAFLVWNFSFKDALDKVDAENSKQATLDTQIEEVKAQASKVDGMNKEMDQWKKDVAKTMEKYDVNYTYEDGYLYLKSIEDMKDANILIDTYTINETTLDSIVEGGGAFEGKMFAYGSTQYNYNFNIDNYANFKRFVTYITSGEGGVKSLDSLTVKFDPDAEFGFDYKGTVIATAYAITDGTNAYEFPAIGVENLGVTLPFETGVEVEEPETEE